MSIGNYLVQMSLIPLQIVLRQLNRSSYTGMIKSSLDYRLVLVHTMDHFFRLSVENNPKGWEGRRSSHAIISCWQFLAHTELVLCFLSKSVSDYIYFSQLLYKIYNTNWNLSMQYKAILFTIMIITSLSGIPDFALWKKFVFSAKVYSSVVLYESINTESRAKALTTESFKGKLCLSPQ